ncbi:MAG: hypothetical protein HFG82_08350 [Dorea sp.]|jgi:uncharacterized membrane protein HdeD (DUF308 family)|nr:hypothetical protein [Dorea sp.]
MKVFSIVFGVLIAICGLSCIFTPLITFLEAGYFLVILLFVYGTVGIIRSVSSRTYGMDFVFNILSIILGVVILAVPKLKLMTDGVLLYLMAFWFMLQGIINIFQSMRQKKAVKGIGWVWTLTLGILGLLVGIYSVIHPRLLVLTFGILVGVYFIESGISMIVMAQDITRDEE